MSKTSFAGLGVSAAVCAALEERGITTPFPVQSMVIGDVAGRVDTGSGKTLAFSVPLVDRLQATGPRPAALILVPTRELAAQIVEEARTVAHARALSITASADSDAHLAQLPAEPRRARPGRIAGAELRAEVARVISPIARPRELHVVPELPKTRSGKIMRRLLRDIAEKRELGDTSTLLDPGVFDAIRAAAP